MVSVLVRREILALWGYEADPVVMGEVLARIRVLDALSEIPRRAVRLTPVVDQAEAEGGEDPGRLSHGRSNFFFRSGSVSSVHRTRSPD
jgi:hypothetical protein